MPWAAEPHVDAALADPTSLAARLTAPDGLPAAIRARLARGESLSVRATTAYLAGLDACVRQRGARDGWGRLLFDPPPPGPDRDAWCAALRLLASCERLALALLAERRRAVHAALRALAAGVLDLRAAAEEVLLPLLARRWTPLALWPPEALERRLPPAPDGWADPAAEALLARALAQLPPATAGLDGLDRLLEALPSADPPVQDAVRYLRAALCVDRACGGAGVVAPVLLSPRAGRPLAWLVDVLCLPPDAPASPEAAQLAADSLVPARRALASANPGVRLEPKATGLAIIDYPGGVHVPFSVAGRSGGAALAAALLAHQSGLTLRDDALASAGIAEESLHPLGGDEHLRAKARAAALAGARVLLVANEADAEAAARGRDDIAEELEVVCVPSLAALIDLLVHDPWKRAMERLIAERETTLGR